MILINGYLEESKDVFEIIKEKFIEITVWCIIGDILYGFILVVVPAHSLSFLPEAVAYSAIIQVLANTMLFAVFPEADIGSGVVPDVNPESLLFVHVIEANVPSPVVPGILSITVHCVHLPLASVPATVLEVVYSPTV